MRLGFMSRGSLFKTNEYLKYFVMVVFFVLAVDIEKATITPRWQIGIVLKIPQIFKFQVIVKNV